MNFAPNKTIIFSQCLTDKLNIIFKGLVEKAFIDTVIEETPEEFQRLEDRCFDSLSPNSVDIDSNTIYVLFHSGAYVCFSCSDYGSIALQNP